MRLKVWFVSSTREFEAQTQLTSIHQGQSKNIRLYSSRFMALVEKMGDEHPKQFLFNLYMWGLQKDIAGHVAISQPISLSNAIQWVEHVDMATWTYNGTGPSKSIGGSSISGGNRGGCGGGRNFGWWGGKGGPKNSRQSFDQQQKKPPNSTYNKRKA